MTTPDDPRPEVDGEFVRVTPSDGITDVPAGILAELGDILSPTDVPSTRSEHDETPPDASVQGDGSGVVLSFPAIESTDEAGDSSVVIIDDSLHGSTMVVDDKVADRILIVDDDSLDTQFEERRERAKRREKFRKIRWVFVAAGAVAFLLAIAGILASPLFSVQSITIEGNVYTSNSTLEEASGMIRGRSIFTLDADGVARRIEKDPWVADARVSKHFFRSIVVEIRERVPVVWYVGADNKARVIDTDGAVIAVLDGWPTKYLQIAGIGPMVEAGAQSDEVYRAAAQLVTSLPEEIRTKTQRLEVSPGGSLSLILKTGTIIRFGEPTDLQNKLVAVVVLLRRQDPIMIKAIDVSAGDPAVEMK